MRTESMEVFFYRRHVPLQTPNNILLSLGDDFINRYMQQQRQRKEDDDHLDDASNCHGCDPNIGTGYSSRRRGQEPLDSLVKTLMSGPMALMDAEFCTGGAACQHTNTEDSSSQSSSQNRVNHLNRFTCAPHDLDENDSYVDASTITSLQSSLAHQRFRKKTASGKPILWPHAQHTMLIKAEKDLILNYRRTSLTALDKVRVLLEDEGQVGQSWKRFATALSNLFSFEKEVESARLGDKKISRDHMPYRKVKVSAVDECLRAFAKQKMDRSVPSLRILGFMLTAYIADLHSVEPSVDAYVDGMSQLAFLEDIMMKEQQIEEDKSTNEGSATTESVSTTQSDTTGSQNSGIAFDNWRESLSKLASPSKIANTIDKGKAALKYVGDLRAGSTSSNSEEGAAGATQQENDLQRKRLVEKRVLNNERLLKDSLTSLCKATTVRTARMAWMYFKSEATQCALSHSAAVSLRDKIDVFNAGAVAKMVKRHQNENKEDMVTELALVQRIVDLGNMKKYPIAGSSKNEDMDITIEIDSDNQDEERTKAALRDNALQIARDRVGRWNSKLAMAIMTAVGVDDPNVHVDQTSRELRLVRKYAIGLREVLNRCIEAVDALRSAIRKGHQNEQKENETTNSGTHISVTREDCMKDLAKLFSGRPGKDTEVTKLLAQNGIVTNDPMGWSTAFGEKTSEAKEHCGLASLGYVQKKDSQTDLLLDNLSDLLNEYSKRVEVVESFVYMECVGVQLEKFFSQKRAQALAGKYLLFEVIDAQSSLLLTKQTRYVRPYISL